jgi:hypothetical protein
MMSMGNGLNLKMDIAFIPFHVKNAILNAARKQSMPSPPVKWLVVTRTIPVGNETRTTFACPYGGGGETAEGV